MRETALVPSSAVVYGGFNLTFRRNAACQNNNKLAMEGREMPITHPKLTVRSISKSFGDLTAISGISAEIKSGEFVSIVGPSGCGKTTFLRMLAGLDAPTSGKILIGEHAVLGPGLDRGFVFQQDNLLPWRTVFDNVRFGLDIAGKRISSAPDTISNLIKLVGLSGFEAYYPHKLSGGMRQRVNLARALAIDPEILLLDEPFSALDAQTREIMQSELLRIWEAGRKTAVFVTHQIDEAVLLSDRVFVFARRPGRIQEVIDIDLKRPRSLLQKGTQQFVDFVTRIWSLIESDVRESVLNEKIV
jgi:NitT/TauT family transport system ATP-binding protein